MAKFYGTIGFLLDPKESSDNQDVWESEVIERSYPGELIKSSLRAQSAQKINDDITVDNQISIISDLFVMEHIAYITYVELHGVKWKVNSIQIAYPRVTLNIGGVYNG